MKYEKIKDLEEGFWGATERVLRGKDVNHAATGNPN